LTTAVHAQAIFAPCKPGIRHGANVVAEPGLQSAMSGRFGQNFLSIDDLEDTEEPNVEWPFVCNLNFEMPRIAAIS
jgi:hypothetical protein